MKLRYFLIEHDMKPWEWDTDYPDEMYGRFFEEDTNTILQIDSAQHERSKNKKK